MTVNESDLQYFEAKARAEAEYIRQLAARFERTDRSRPLPPPASNKVDTYDP